MTALHSTKWVLSGERTTATTTTTTATNKSSNSSSEASRFHALSVLLAVSPECAVFAGAIGPYLRVSLSESFARETSVRFAVGPDDVLGLLLHWVKAGETK